MPEEVKAGILAVCATGRTNMFSIGDVQRIAIELDYWETALWISEHTREYVRFILTGETDATITEE